MTVYKLIECEDFNQINQEILSWVDLQEWIATVETFWNPVSVADFMKVNPKFQKWCMEQSVMISDMALTVGRNANCCSAHIDTPPARYKLSWPIANTSGTYNRWFQYKNQNPSIHINPLGGQAFDNLDDLEEIDRVEVTQPMIIDAGIPHDVFFDPSCKFPRLGLQCKLFKEPTDL